jgi:hypothetical protein
VQVEEGRRRVSRKPLAGWGARRAPPRLLEVVRQGTEYTDDIGDAAEMIVRYETVRGRLVSYSVVLTVRGIGTVRVFDNAHGINEMHRYTRSGEKLPGVEFDRGTPSEAMNAATGWIRAGWEEMRRPWMT